MNGERKFRASEEIRGDIKMARFALSPEENPSNDEYMYNLAAYYAQQTHEVIPEIARNADLMTNWEASSRYSHSLVKMREKISTVLDAAEKLADNISE